MLKDITFKLFIILPVILSLFFSFSESDDRVFIDSNISFEEAVSGLKFPETIKKQLCLVDVLYYSFDNSLHKGQIIIHKDLSKDVIDIFEYIREIKFPVNKVVPISFYKWNDSLSIADNNTSGFNYRFVESTRVLSKHASGRAIDLNPYLNPLIRPGNAPESHRPYDPKKPGTLSRNSPVVEYFLKKGWNWGGRWRSVKDYQHFEK